VTKSEADRLIAALDAELSVAESERSTGASSDQLALAKRLVDWIAVEATEGRRPDKSPTFGSLGHMVADGFDPRSTLGSDLIGFERSVGEALARRGE
jgi:hypothetical protein